MNPLIILLFGAIFIWLSLISLYMYKAMTRYNKLAQGVTKQSLSAILEKILAQLDISQKRVDEIIKRCDKIEYEGHFHAQKIGLLRFNPFSDTGGDQSFIIAILNAKDDGILISNLHGRAGTRWYAKTVSGGKGTEHELSNEEKQVIKKAKIIA